MDRTCWSFICSTTSNESAGQVASLHRRSFQGQSDAPLPACAAQKPWNNSRKLCTSRVGIHLCNHHAGRCLPPVQADQGDMGRWQAQGRQSGRAWPPTTCCALHLSACLEACSWLQMRQVLTSPQPWRGS